MPGKAYAESDKRMAVAYYITGNRTFSEASRKSGIGESTIRSWKSASPSWWERVANEIWAQEEDKLRSRYSQIVDKGTIGLLDRIENGDTRVHPKTGELFKVPVSARDLMMVTGTSQDKLRISHGQPTSISGKAEVSTKDRLEELKNAASSLASVKAA